MNKEEYRAGLWKKTSDKGTTYYSGKIKIGDREFYLTLFKNNKTNEKQPDLNIIVRDSINTQGKQESIEKGHKNSVKNDNSVIFEEFGNKLEFDEEPF